MMTKVQVALVKTNRRRVERKEEKKSVNVVVR
jgi:hypothetical protein